MKLYETSAITQYIDAVFPGDSLIPADPVAAAMMNQWTSVVVDYYYGSMIRNYVLEYVFPSGANGSPDEKKIRAAVEETKVHLAVADKGLSGGKYLAGDELSLADLFLAPIVFYLSKMPESKETLGAAPAVSRWFEKLFARPSFTATLPPPPAKAS